MQIATLPSDEQARLESLRALDILDSPQEERFDRLTRMARRLFRVPIALVSLVDDDRQWFKSRAGLDIGETPRDTSFCAHAILGEGVFTVHDARRDLRFADNPLVTGDPYIRFYAGQPLRAPDGHKLGTLCLLDREPRVLDAEDLAMLADLAQMVERELAVVELATVDELTRIANRRGFRLLAQHSLRLCRREGIPAVLVYIDLDDFKPVNDVFGHAEGDRLLAFFAERMKRSFRSTDVAARLGGDEFTALLLNADMAHARAVIEALRGSLDEGPEAARRGYRIRFSSGIVPFDPAHHGSIDDLLAAADAQMYAAKQNKRR